MACPASPTGRPVDTRWRVVTRPGSGQFVESERGTLLFRLEQDATGLVLYPYDKKLGGEVRIPIRDLPALPVRA